MNYSISNLTEVADCNELLTWAAREKGDLEFRKYSDTRLTERYAETSLEVNADLLAVNAELSVLVTIIAALPDGPSRDENLNKKTRLEYRKFTLETRKQSFGTVALLEKELDLGRVIQEIEEADAFIAAVTTRKVELETAMQEELAYS